MRLPPAFSLLKHPDWLALCLVVLVVTPAQAATLLFSHSGATNPTTEGWTASGTSSKSAVVNDLGTGVDAWRVYDPGGASISGTYTRVFTSTQTSDALLTGWTLDATIRYVPPDPLIATSATNNAWCTVMMDEGITDRRTLYGVYFGNNIGGDTLVRLYGATDSFTVSGGYHDYQLVWNPETANASLFIDGELKLSGYEGGGIDYVSAGRVYWGDNTSTAITSGRGAHYAYVGLTTGTAAIPEPSRSSLMLLAAGALMWRRRRS